MPEVGDVLEAEEGTLFNPLWDIHIGLIGKLGWDYQWYREADPIAGATDMYYEVVADDVGSRLRVEATPYDTWVRNTGPFMSDYTDEVT